MTSKLSWAADLEPELLRLWLSGDDRAGRELAEGFWDRQILRKYAGILKLPVIPRPDPSPEIGFLHNEILAETLGQLAGEPEPEPNRGRSLIAVLREPKYRIKAAEELRSRLLAAAKALDAEIGKAV